MSDPQEPLDDDLEPDTEELEFVRPLTLPQILAKLHEADNCLIKLTDDQQQLVVTDLKDKVDAYKYIDNKFKSETARLAFEIKELQLAKKGVMKAHREFRDAMRDHMLSNEFQKLPGVRHNVLLIKKTEIELKLPEANPATYLEFKDLGLVKRTYSWDTTKVEAAFKKDPETFKDFGKKVIKPYVQFKVRTEFENEREEISAVVDAPKQIQANNNGIAGPAN